MTQNELDKRMALEREVVAKLIEVAAKHGYAITKVDDGGEERIKCTTAEQAMDAVFAVDESTMFFKHPDQPKAHCAVIVLGNSGYDCIANNSEGQIWSDVIAEVGDFCDAKDVEANSELGA